MDGKTPVTGRGVALRAGQRVFLSGFRVEEHRKVPPHGQKALVDHLLRSRAHHHPVMVFHGQTHECIADSAAY